MNVALERRIPYDEEAERMPEVSDMVTVREAARQLGISPLAVQQRIANGEMEAVRITARLLLVPRSEVERWKAVGRRKGGRPRKEPSAAEHRRDEAAHDDALDEARRRISGRPDES